LRRVPGSVGVSDISAPPAPVARLTLGVTGHRDSNRAFVANRAAVEAVLDEILSAIAVAAARESELLGAPVPVRMHSLLADGIDQLAYNRAQVRGWEMATPLPFGRDLNLVINTHPSNSADARTLLAGGEPEDKDLAARAAAIRQCYAHVTLFELADRDAETERLYLAALDAPGDLAHAQAWTAHVSECVALAGRVMIEQSDLIIGVWDGAARNLGGGTGHTIAAALEMGAPVIRIDPSDPLHWHIMQTPEALSVTPDSEARDQLLAALVRTALRPGEGGALKAGAEALASEAWHPHSSRLAHGYRRIEALFDGGKRLRRLVQTYETPAGIANGRAAPMLQAAADLPGIDPVFVQRIDGEVLQRYAWADGISARLSDAYRGGMVANFLLSAMAIVIGIAYQPLVGVEHKWIFASGEFLLLGSILVITWLGGRWRWHKRWFETRRVAEYFRHAPIMMLLGVARPAGRWLRGADTSWPEYYARHGLRALGLPQVRVTSKFLRQALRNLLDDHVVRQRDYHLDKARRLATVHHGLDRLSERLFLCAVVSVFAYLMLAFYVRIGLFPDASLNAAAKTFTFLGVFFPTFGASIAGIRYFGDFERFAAISQVTARKLDAVHGRIELLLSAPDGAIRFDSVAELAHATDEIVVAEIENWQAVFGGKTITVPV
jgi:hypothetical protein